MADSWKTPAGNKAKPLPAPRSIIGETTYRGRRIVCTDDPAVIGKGFPDAYGFTADRGFVVLDEFDEHVFPAGMHWFYTPDDAACAIEMLDTILPTIQKGTPATTLLYEYGVMRSYRREFWHTYGAIADIQRMCKEAAQLDDNPRDEIASRLHLLRQQVAQGRSIG